ncbi:caspase family protein [Elusimicrobiota bacterium]
MPPTGKHSRHKFWDAPIGISRILLPALAALLLAGAWPAHAERGISVKPRSPLGGEVKGRQWLLVIGIDSYLHWPRLKTAVNDAKAVKEVLLKRYHFDPEHTVELYDEQATRKNILGKLRYLARNTGQNDSLLIFYAGHGQLDSITKDGSWIPVGGARDEDSAWISNHDVKKYLRADAIKAKHVLLISDSCFAGDFFRGLRGKLPEMTNQSVKRAYARNSRQAITSGGLEPVADRGFGGNSVFSHFLVQALRENDKPFLLASTLFPPIRAGVADNAKQFPEFGSLHGTGGQQGGELVLFLKGGSRLKDLEVGQKAKRRELSRLQVLEDQARAAQEKESAAIAEREREIADLDKKIAQMKSRLGQPTQEGGDSLDAMIAMIEKKEAQAKRLKTLREKREADEKKRLAEIAKLKAEQREQLVQALKKDLAKYDRIASSQYGEDMKAAAWESLVQKYPDLTKNLAPGDTGALLFTAESFALSDRDLKITKWSLARLAKTPIGKDILTALIGGFSGDLDTADLAKAGVDIRETRLRGSGELSTLEEKKAGGYTIILSRDVSHEGLSERAAILGGELANVLLRKRWTGSLPPETAFFNKAVHRAQVGIALGLKDSSSIASSDIAQQLAFEIKIWKNDPNINDKEYEGYGAERNAQLKQLLTWRAMDKDDGLAFDPVESMLRTARGMHEDEKGESEIRETYWYKKQVPPLVQRLKKKYSGREPGPAR